MNQSQEQAVMISVRLIFGFQDCIWKLHLTNVDNTFPVMIYLITEYYLVGTNPILKIVWYQGHFVLVNNKTHLKQ